jgi:hypothetical protein
MNWQGLDVDPVIWWHVALLIITTPAFAYVLARTISKAFFNSKLDYQQELFNRLENREGQ